jgi:hypothetical protein
MHCLSMGGMRLVGETSRSAVGDPRYETHMNPAPPVTKMERSKSGVFGELAEDIDSRVLVADVLASENCECR